MSRLTRKNRRVNSEDVGGSTFFGEMRSGGAVAFNPAAGVNYPGLVTVVPPWPRRTLLRWSGMYGITVAGGGVVSINMYECVGLNGSAVLRGVSDPEYIPAAQPASLLAGRCSGEVFLDPSTQPRLLGGNLAFTRDAASALAVSIVEYDNDYNRAWIEVVQQ